MNNPLFLQIIDSRGNPTIQGQYTIDGSVIRVGVPSGASTGKHEAVELRDRDISYKGKSVLQATHNADALAQQVSWTPADVTTADATMKNIDGSPNKSRLGANALLAVSMLQAKVQAHQQKIPDFMLLAQLADTTPSLPMPFANIINGGRHADNALQFQEFMIVPTHAESFYEATQQIAEVTHVLKELIQKQYGASQTGVGDEGGFAPNIKSPEDACTLLVTAMQECGYQMGIAIDAAASEFCSDGKYEALPDQTFSATDLGEYYVRLAKKFPIISIEDPFHEDDFESFAHLRARLAAEKIKCQVVGDDLTVTNPDRIQEAASHASCDCLLLKVNQIGTVTEAIHAARTAMDARWGVMVSHRSGETTDFFIADLAVGLGCGQIKLGAPVRGERTAKYNRLLELEHVFDLAFPTNKAL